jgi:hypothetical protein
MDRNQAARRRVTFRFQEWKCMYNFWQIFNDSQTKYKAKDERTSSAPTTLTASTCWPGRILVFLYMTESITAESFSVIQLRLLLRPGPGSAN